MTDGWVINVYKKVNIVQVWIKEGSFSLHYPFGLPHYPNSVPLSPTLFSGLALCNSENLKNIKTQFCIVQ